MEIKKTIPVDDTMQRVLVTITHGSDSYGYDANTPVLEGDELQAHCDANEFNWLNNILYQVYGRNIQFPTLAEWDEWISSGHKLEEITEERITQAAVEAADAVVGERQKTVESSEEVTTIEIVEQDGKMVQKSVTNTVVTNTPETKEVPLFDEAGEEVGTTTVPVMESYEVSPAVEAVEEVSETVVVRPESVVEKVAWKDTAE